MSVTVAPVSSSKLLKARLGIVCCVKWHQHWVSGSLAEVADLLGSFERNLILPVQQAPLVPPQLPQQAKRKAQPTDLGQVTGKVLLPDRFGKGCHLSYPKQLRFADKTESAYVFLLVFTSSGYKFHQCSSP